MPSDSVRYYTPPREYVEEWAGLPLVACVLWDIHYGTRLGHKTAEGMNNALTHARQRANSRRPGVQRRALSWLRRVTTVPPNWVLTDDAALALAVFRAEVLP